MLLQAESVRLIESVNLVPGTAISVEAIGLGDDSLAIASETVVGNSIRPLVPVHGRVVRGGDGSLDISWIRRARIDAGWHDGVDQALVEDREQYAVSIFANGITIDNRTVETRAITLTASQIAAFDLQSSQLIIEIRQIGSFALSDPLILHATVDF